MQCVESVEIGYVTMTVQPRGILRSNTAVSDVSNGEGMLKIAPLITGPGEDCWV